MFLILLTNWQQIDKPLHEPSHEAYGCDRTVQTEPLASCYRNLERNFSWSRYVGRLSPHPCRTLSSNSRTVPRPTFQQETSTSIRLDIVADSTRLDDCSLCSIVALVNLRCMERCDSDRIRSTIELRTPQLIGCGEFTTFHSSQIIEIVLIKFSGQAATEESIHREGFNRPIHNGIFVV